ncbi:MAG TPA: TolC family protein [Prolixibacteraceae bacterium]|nr:TolC family protein [Prolixibacteraceae bacterium]
MNTFKIHTIKVLISVILSSFLFLSAYSEEGKKWSLSDCVEYGLNHSLSLKISENNSEKEKMNYRQTQWQLAPSLNGGAYGNMNFNRSTDQNNQISSGNTYYLNYGLSASLDIFKGLSRINQISAMKFNSLAFSQEVEQQKNLLYLNIVKHFSESVYYKQQVAIAEEQLQLSMKEQERIESKVELGLLENSAEEEIKATVSGNRYSLEKQRNSYRSSLLSLTQLIELPDTTGFDLSATEFNLLVPSEKDYTSGKVYQQACDNLPNLKEKEYRLRYYKKLRSAYEGQILPSISLSGNYDSYFYSTDTLSNGKTTPLQTQYNNYLNPSIGVSVNIPIFNKRSTDFQIRKSKIDIDNAILDLEQQKKEIFNEIQNAIQLFNASYYEYVNASDNLKFVEKSFGIYREKYSLGLINSTDFITAQNQLLQSKNNVLEAKFNWIYQEKLIRLYCGYKEF